MEENKNEVKIIEKQSELVQTEDKSLAIQENKQPDIQTAANNKEWDETRLVVFLVGISLIIEGILIYFQAGNSQFYVSIVTGIGGLVMSLIAWFVPFDDEDEDKDSDKKQIEEVNKNQQVEIKNEIEKTEVSSDLKQSDTVKTEKIDENKNEQTVEREKVEEEGWFTRLTNGLSKTRTGFIGKLKKLVLGSTKIDSDLLDELEEALYEADIGVKTTEELLDNLRKKVEEEEIKDPNLIYAALKEDLKGRLNKYIQPPVFNPDGLTLYMIIGVNGVGKTTTIAKLANYFKNSGKKVVLAAGDTFRAAAIDQLCIWGERIGVDVIHGNEGGDPGALVFDAIVAAKKRNADILIVDTAGRMHNKTNLMAELQKVKKIATKESCGGPHEIMLVLDATTGQNAVQQAKQFNEAIPITGLVVTKLDGTAKGGVLFAVEEEVSAPVKFIGVGEKMNDLMPFNPEQYLEALFADDSEKKKESDYIVAK